MMPSIPVVKLLTLGPNQIPWGGMEEREKDCPDHGETLAGRHWARAAVQGDAPRTSPVSREGSQL